MLFHELRKHLVFANDLGFELLDLVLVAKIGDGHLLDEMALEDGDLIGAREVTTLLLLVHEKPPYR